MPIRESAPFLWQPVGLSDALDATDSFPGACKQLSDFILGRVNRGATTCRPGVGNPVTQFGGFASPGFISVMFSLGSRIYGMISTATNPGKDQPFVYDTAANDFIALSGVTAANVPTSPSTVGSWTPPTMANVSTKILVTHPGFDGVAGRFIGVFDIANPLAPVWSVTNTATTPLPSPPRAVAQFSNRAWYVIGNWLYFSDVLVPTTITNATQILKLGTTDEIVAIHGLGMGTDQSGILQALIAFKGAGKGIWQATGDVALSNLTLNEISSTIGCAAPRSITTTPPGLAFMASDGPRLVGLRGEIQFLNPDITQPFQHATEPTRACAAYANSMYRISLDTVMFGSALTGDFWYDLLFQKWTGWHSFTYDCAVAVGSSFYLSAASIPGKIFKSDVVASGATVFQDNAVQYSSFIESSTFQVEQTASVKSVIESTVEIVQGLGASYTLNLEMQDESEVSVGSASILGRPSGSLWGSALWGEFKWNAGKAFDNPVPIPWSAPVVFTNPKLLANVIATTGFAMKHFMFRMQKLRRTLLTGL